jgi:hypothetical protein
MKNALLAVVASALIAAQAASAAEIKLFSLRRNQGNLS